MLSPSLKPIGGYLGALGHGKTSGVRGTVGEDIIWRGAWEAEDVVGSISGPATDPLSSVSHDEGGNGSRVWASLREES